MVLTQVDRMEDIGCRKMDWILIGLTIVVCKIGFTIVVCKIGY